jgi:localization factor PodJL
VDGIDPSVKERAEAAAQRAGMTLGEWMNAALTQHEPRRGTPDIAEIHQRLDAITRQVEQFSVPAPARGETAVAKQLNDAISRLDARLSNIASPPTAPRTQAPSYAPAQAPSPLDLSIAEIVARQSELDGTSPAQAALNRNSPSFGPASEHPAFANLERQLFGITSQIESLRQPDGIEQSIAAFRTELSEIRYAITEALPKRAIESLENEIRSLGRRIDETHQNGADTTALAGIERALSDIRSELRSLTPAEQLTGFDDAIRHLGGKIDSIVRSSQDPGTLRQLDDAISALKTIVANIASNDALSQLADHVRALSQKVDQLAQTSHGDMFAALEQRIAVLTSALEQRDRPAAAGDSSHFDNAVRAISDRLDHLQVGNDASSTFTHVEQRVAHLLERLEAVETPPSNFGRVEDGLSDIMRLLQTQRAAAENAPRAASSMDPDFVEAIKRELSDMRIGQMENDRHTQDALEVVHNTLGHVVDRLAHIEGDLRQSRTVAATPSQPSTATSAPQRPNAPPIPPQYRPELPNPAQMQAAARPQSNAEKSAPAARPTEPPAAKTAAPVPPLTEPAPSVVPAQQQQQQPRHLPRSPIDPDLPPDHPLEPGSRIQAPRPSSAERIANSEIALQDLPAKPSEPVSSSNFIQAARRAAQAAQAAADSKPKPAAKKPNRVSTLNEAARINSKPAATPATGSGKVRALLVGASVIVIVLGTFKMAMNFLNSGDTTRSEPAAESRAVSPQQPPAPPADNAPAAPDATPAPSMTSPTPIGKQSMSAPASTVPAAPVEMAPAPAAPAPVAQPSPQTSPDVTGSISPLSWTASAMPSITAPPAGDQLPETIGGPLLRTAALKGDPSAAYEIGLRYAEGHGVPVNFDEAAKWYGRAAQANIVPAIFRLGTLYEKGLGVKKDIDTANRYYRQAADRGNAKAMHNLAVLEADGGGKPNYKNAVYWFLKAGNRGVADSQFNLGILYARGIGVTQDLTEAYKWFSLAAAQGDADSGRKRDDIATRLDAQSLAAAKLAVQTFALEQQPADAVSVAAPVGGWDAKTAAKPAAKTSARAAKPAKTKTAAN